MNRGFVASLSDGHFNQGIATRERHEHAGTTRSCTYPVNAPLGADDGPTSLDSNSVVNAVNVTVHTLCQDDTVTRT
jgi:hypothetical protein